MSIENWVAKGGLPCVPFPPPSTTSTSHVRFQPAFLGHSPCKADGYNACPIPKATVHSPDQSTRLVQGDPTPDKKVGSGRRSLSPERFFNIRVGLAVSSNELPTPARGAWYPLEDCPDWGRQTGEGQPGPGQ